MKVNFSQFFFVLIQPKKFHIFLKKFFSEIYLPTYLPTLNLENTVGNNSGAGMSNLSNYCWKKNGMSCLKVAKSFKALFIFQEEVDGGLQWTMLEYAWWTVGSGQHRC